MRDVIRDVCTRVEGGDNFSAALTSIPSFLIDCMSVWWTLAKGRLTRRNSRASGHVSREHRPAAQEGEIRDDVILPRSRNRDWHHHFSSHQGGAVFAEIFSGFGAKLPAPTQFLIDLSNVVKK